MLIYGVVFIDLQVAAAVSTPSALPVLFSIALEYRPQNYGMVDMIDRHNEDWVSTCSKPRPKWYSIILGSDSETQSSIHGPHKGRFR
jgi:hypothetical protein